MTRAGRADGAAERLEAILGKGQAALARRLAAEGVRTRAGLRAPGVLARLPRRAQASALYGPYRSAPLAEAAAVAAEVCRRLRLGGVKPPVCPVGGLRRGAAKMKDLDFLVEGGAAGLEGLRLARARPGDKLSIATTVAGGGRRCSLVLRRAGPRPRHYRADFFHATRGERPFALFHHTGGRQYNIRIRAFAKKRGWLLNQYGLFEADGGRRVRGSGAVRSERDLAALLGVRYREPCERA